MDAETKQALEAMETRILERIEATETKLLRAALDLFVERIAARPVLGTCDYNSPGLPFNRGAL